MLSSGEVKKRLISTLECGVLKKVDFIMLLREISAASFI